MGTNKYNHKITKEQFIEAYRACEGNFSQTAKYIQDRYKISYSKQAVYDRALSHPEEVENLFAIMGNQCSTTLMSFADDTANDIKLRARLYVQVMNQISKRERLKAFAEKGKAKKRAKEEVEEVFDINGYIVRFPSSADEQPTAEELEKETQAILNACGNNLDAPYQND